MPEFEKYDGTKDPWHHLRHYYRKMLQYGDYEQFVVATFQESLSGSALNWFMSLRAEDIPSWFELAKKFVEQYQYNIETPRSFLELNTMEMAEDQKFEKYAIDWRSEAAKHFSPHLLGATDTDVPRNTQRGLLFPSHGGKESSRGRPRLQQPLLTAEGERRLSVYVVNLGHPGSQQYSVNFTPVLLATPAYAPPTVHYQPQHPAQPVYYSAPPASQQIGHHYPPASTQQYRPPASRAPQPVQQTPAAQGQQSAVQCHGHDTLGPDVREPGDCSQGKGSRCIRSCSGSLAYPVEEGKSPAHISLLALLLSSEPHREALLRVLTAAQIPKETALDRIEETISSIFSNTISFSDDEIPSEGWAHSRALHIVCKCNNFVIGRVLIDNGSALNVCSVSTLKQMNVDLNRICLSKIAVRAFDGSRREVNGEIDLLIDVGPCSFSVTFQVLDIPNAFSLLLERPWIHSAGAVPSSLHQRLKFIVGERLITVKGEEDYAIYKETVVPYISIGDNENLPFHSFETISVVRDYGEAPFEERLEEPRPIYFGEGLDEDGRVPEIEESLRHLEDRQLTSVEPTEEINVGTEEESRTLKIGTSLDPIQRARMIDFLKEYQEVFAWSYTDMLGLDPSIVKHFLPLDTERFQPKRQHLQRQRASLLLRIKEEVIKQINASFLEVCNYSEWVANIVPVEKKDGTVRVCVDYRDLNKASPNDNFPLPHIDVLVDNTVCHTLLSFMDGFSGYNQIRMAEEDKIKTTFITMWGTFYYRVMPFGLKNAGATYQRAMVALTT
ncbi:hypothetical protein CRG98_009567 [Punica granatum]|uniref:Retrotransposon gag domain-containing protein n=1 Tax=Punica granatum TaxID=22663 RepID=A0A2I0KNP3_PUNGR|nr:hypothetical protein CRG98_009567 [Punica granatum]